MIRAMFFDLDGTLLNSAKQIPFSAICALQECREKGIKLFIATARARPPRLEQMLGWTEKEKGLFDGGIYSNGGCIGINGSFLYNCILPEVVQFVLKEISCYPGIHIAIQREDERHAFNHALSPASYGPWAVTEEEILPIDADCCHKAVKILLYDHDLIDAEEKIPMELVKRLEEFCLGKARFYLTDGGKTIQITGQSASKYAGVEKIRLELGLGRDEIAVFGDDTNDIEMLSGYEYSIAMGNASQDVQKAVKRVTKSNDEDGIAFAIHTFLPID